jgi:hypothetical protein
MIFTLILVFISSGILTVEQKDFATMEECNKAGEVRVAEQQRDPKFDLGLFGACIPNAKQKV